MKRILLTTLTLTALAFAAGCSGNASDGAKSLLSLMPHHDHTSRRGGPVLMNGDTHFEIAVQANGEHAVLFSDAYRKPLPASRIEEATLTVLRRGAAPEALALDAASGEEGMWVAYGQPITGTSVDVRVEYRGAGEAPYSIDVPITLGGAVAHAH